MTGKLGWIRLDPRVQLICERVAELRDSLCVTGAGGSNVTSTGPNHVRHHPEPSLPQTRRTE